MPRCEHRTWMMAVLCTTLLFPTIGEAAPPATSGKWDATIQRNKLAAKRRESAPSSKPPADRDRSAKIRMHYYRTPWANVLKAVAKQAGLTLVMDQAPPGTFTRRDRAVYTTTEALRLLNRELEPQGFRLVMKDAYLVVLDLPTLRARYLPPVLRHRDGEANLSEVSHTGEGTASAEKPVPTLRTTHVTSRPAERETRPNANAVRPVSHTEHATDEVPAAEATYIARHRSATELARAVYEAYQPSARLLQKGPQGLPAFRAEFATAANTKTAAREERASFEVGIDTERQRLVIESRRTDALRLAELFSQLDQEEAGSTTTRLLRAKPATSRLAGQLERELKRLLAQRQRTTIVPLRRGQAALNRNGDSADGDAETTLPAQPAPPKPGEQPPADGEAAGEKPSETLTERELRSILGELQLKGEVTIQSMPDLGVLIVTGNEKDVEQVLTVIRMLEQLAVGTAPEIRLVLLRHVNSEALADLLNSVYENLGQAVGATGQQARTVSVIPVVKPNAILVIAPGADLQSILDLATELDRPVDPELEFVVFPLKYALATQVVTLLETFYQDQGNARPGLATRVRAVADVRTNSLIVQARPRDLEEVAALIRKIDLDQSSAVSQMRVFPLKNAVADELADVINAAIQSITNPPTAVTGQVTAAAGAGGEASQRLREVKSMVLDFLTSVDGAEKRIRSGILADIRVTSDPRMNALIVTAPRQSMALMAALITELDRPSPTVADIKVFTLVNADATSMADLLQSLFGQQDQTTGQLGIQLAGAEDASSSIVPLRFSVDVRTNSIIAIGGAEALRVVEAILLRMDEGDIRQRKTIVLRLKNSPATDVADAINEFLTSQRDLLQIDPELVSVTELLEREVIVVPEPVTNSLLISATPRYFDEIHQMVMDLDRAPEQVIIQALLVEVELTDNDEFGVELGFQSSVLFDRSITEILDTLTTTVSDPSTGIQTTTETIVSQQSTPGFQFANQPLGNNTAAHPLRVGNQGFSNFAVGRTNNDLGFGGLVVSASSATVSVLLRALSAHRRVEVLSRPQVRTLDNQLAQISVGQLVPIVNGVNVQQIGVANPLIEQAEVGILLSVTPRISPDGIIVMEVVATKGALSPEGVPIFVQTDGSVIESPIRDDTTIQTTVSVPNGQTIVLGGMITKEDDVFERKVPWLGDLPLLGKAFRYDARASRRTELLIFLTPRIIRSDEDNEWIKQVEIERLNFLEEEAERIHGPLFSVPGSETPFTKPLVPPMLDDQAPTTVDPSLESGTPLPGQLPPVPGATPDDDSAADDQPGSEPTTNRSGGPPPPRRIPKENTVPKSR